MPALDHLERRFDTDTTSSLVDGLLVTCLVAAVAAGWATGLSPFAIGLLVVGSVALEHAVSRATRRQILDAAETTGSEPDDALHGLVTGVADRMALSTPRVIVTPSQETGVTVLQGPDGPVLLLSRPLLADLDDSALRAVIAHELAHLGDSHIRFDNRDPVAHVVGAAAFWVVVGQHLGPVLSIVGLGTYVGAGVFRNAALPQLYYLCASLGIVLVPLGLIAFAHRLQERQADDRAVAVTSPQAFCRGLFHVTRSRTAAPLSGNVARTTPTSERRGLIARLTATHPPLEHRLARYGVSVEEMAEE